jgi:Ni/Co efflux regulator RcnB
MPGTEKVTDMRKFIIAVLLAGAAASPALAQDHGRWHHDEAQSNNRESHEDRSQAHEQRQEVREQVRAERSNGGANAERMQQAQQQQVRQYERRQVQEGQRGGWDRSRFEGQQQVVVQQQQQQQAQRQAYGNWRDRQSGDRDGDQRRWSGSRGGYAGQGQQVEQQRSGSWARDRGSWSQNRDGDYRQRDTQQQRYRSGSRWAGGGWNRDWRNDRHYDWRNYRDRHRSTFHLGIYYDPFGYSYRQFDIGYNLAPLYFSQRYWIDPSIYQLPYPPPGTQWVRYWNDAVLVDMYTGEVVDVIHNFFW